MASIHRPFAVPLLLLAQVPLLMIVLVVLALRLEDERARVSAQVDARAQSLSLALTSYVQGVEGHLRVLANEVPEEGGELAAFLRDAQAVLQVTGLEGIRLATPAGATLLQVGSALHEGTLSPAREPTHFLFAVSVDRAGRRHVLAAHLRPRDLLAAIEHVGVPIVPSGWGLRIMDPDGRAVTDGFDAASGFGLAAVHRSAVNGWQAQVSAPASAVYASVWKSAGRELLLLLLAVVLAPPLAWQLVRSLRQGATFTDSELQHELLHEVEARQQAVARELHDSVGSSLSGIGLLLSTGRRLTRETQLLKVLDKAQEQVTKSAQQVRQISRGMMPVGQAAGGLLPALQQMTEEISGIQGIRCTVLARGDFRDLPATQGTHLFRIVQEATGNAMRHGRAPYIRILLARAGRNCRLTIVDNGCGCNPELLYGASGGMGMRSMRKRAAAIGGSMELLAQPGRGLRVRIGWIAAPSTWDDGGVERQHPKPLTAAREAPS